MLKYFGTDGIRGVVDKKLTSSLAYNVGKSLGKIINDRGLTKKVIIGKDTRLSGDTLTYSLASGLMDYGVDVVMLGIVPTACVSYLSSKSDVGFGVMITASHNTPDMNGIKIINNLGYKISLQDEIEIESLLHSPHVAFYEKGKLTDGCDLVEKYLKFVRSISPSLKGVRIAVDCANGSNYKIAPQTFRLLGAEVIEINTDNKGAEINNNCGSLYPDVLRQEVLTHKCDIGFAFDGDGDRLVVITRKGHELKGDELIYLLARNMLENDTLNSLTVVGTLMTNLGCEESLLELGIKLVRVDVGDKNVIEKMREKNYSLGGETSGHICLHQYNTTCDALINCLQLLKFVNNDFDIIEEKLLPFKRHNSVLKNINVSDDFREGYNQNHIFLEGIKEISEKHKDTKIVVRPSGTESVIRVLVESKDDIKNLAVLKEIEKFINAQLK